MWAYDTGWIRAVGSIHGGMRHWLDRGDGIDSWGACHGPPDTGCIEAMGLIQRGALWGCDGGVGGGCVQHWLVQGDGIDLWDASWGCATGLGRWD